MGSAGVARPGCALIDTASAQAVIGFLSSEPNTLGAVRLKSPTQLGAEYKTVYYELSAE